MGEDKCRIRLGRRTLLGHVRALVRELGLPLRLIAKDRVERCGPLGGLFTALDSSRHQTELFLACDMPFVSVHWLHRLIREAQGGERAVFTEFDGMPGFPCLLPVRACGVVRERIEAGQLSLRGLCEALQGSRLPVEPESQWRFFNINTPRALEEARKIWDQQRRARGG